MATIASRAVRSLPAAYRARRRAQQTKNFCIYVQDLAATIQLLDQAAAHAYGTAAHDDSYQLDGTTRELGRRLATAVRRLHLDPKTVKVQD